MTFSLFCVGLVVIILSIIVSGFFGLLTSLDDPDNFSVRSVMISTIAFGTCLTALICGAEVNFSTFCIGVVINLGSLLVGAAIFGVGQRLFEAEIFDSPIISWLVFAIGYGICFTILLYKRGVIQ